MDPDSFSLFCDQLKRYVKERLVPAEAEVIENNCIPEGILQEMQDMGLFGVTVPEQYGGSGMSVSQYIETVKILSWAAPAYRSTLSLNMGLTNLAIIRAGTEEQKQYWLPQISGGKLAAFGLTEPDSGSDASNLKTMAVKKGSNYVINGTKRFITNAPIADFILVMARTSKEKLPRNQHISAFILPMNLPGISTGKPEKKLGQTGSLLADVIFEDVVVPESALLGAEEGKGFEAAMMSLDKGRLAISAAAVGYGKRILECGIDYAIQRKAFGQPIANFQLIQAMLADSQAELYAAECMLADASKKADSGARISKEISCTKLFSTETCNRIADRVLQIHGGSGYVTEYEAERFFRDSRLFTIYEGTSQIQQLIIAKQLIRERS